MKLTSLLYPQNWQEIARFIKEACDYRCLECGRQCRRPGEFYLGWEYELTAAHLDSDYDAPVINVAALCRPCHLKFDSPLVWVARRRRQRLRRQLAGQLVFALNSYR